MTFSGMDFGLSFGDILGLIVTTVSLVVAILAIILAWGFGKRYQEHVAEIKELQEHSSRYQGSIEKSIVFNKQAIMLMKLTIYHLYRLHDTTSRVERSKVRLENIKKYGVWAGRKLEGEEKDRIIERAKGEVDRLVEQARTIDREVLFLLTDRPNRRTNLNDLIENGDHSTLRLFSELEQLGIDGWDKRELLRAIGQLEYRLFGIRGVKAYDSSSWTGIN